MPFIPTAALVSEGEPFNGGTITEPLAITLDPGDPNPALNLTGGTGGGAVIMYAYDGNGLLGLTYGVGVGLQLAGRDDGSVIFQVGPTGAVTISPSDPAATGLVIEGPPGSLAEDAFLLQVRNETVSVLDVTSAGEVAVRMRETWAACVFYDTADAPVLSLDGNGNITLSGDTRFQGDVGFFGASAAPLPATPTTAQEIYDGLVSLGLFAAGGTIASGGVAGVVLRSSTIVGDGTSTVDTDGIVTASGDADMQFNGTGGLFRFSGGLGAFHEAHSWIPAPGDGTDKVCVVYIGPPGDAGSSPAGFGYQMDNGVLVAAAAAHIESIRVQDDTCLIASILVPAAATRSDECTITDLRVFVA